MVKSLSSTPSTQCSAPITQISTTISFPCTLLEYFHAYTSKCKHVFLSHLLFLMRCSHWNFFYLIMYPGDFPFAYREPLLDTWRGASRLCGSVLSAHARLDSWNLPPAVCPDGTPALVFKVLRRYLRCAWLPK